MTLLIMQFSPSSYLFIPLWSKYSPQHPVLKHHGMARTEVADGGDALQFWRAAANILNKQSRTAENGWFSSLGLGRGANPSP
jgi:hypothetical protein